MSRLLAPSIVIVDVDAGVAHAEQARVAAALTRQVLEHFAPEWGVMATVRAATPDKPPRPGEWRLELRKTPTIDDALGYHDRQSDGTPVLFVFPPLCAECNVAWSSCASHEILEALADPGLHRVEQLNDGRIAALEVCDQVEGDTYEIDGVAVSNFNTEDNYAPPDAAGRFDYLGKCTAAFEVRPGGYAQVYSSDKGWTQIGEMRGYRAKLAELGLSRGTKRQRHHG